MCHQLSGHEFEQTIGDVKDSKVCPLIKSEQNKKQTMVAQMVKNLPAMQETWVRALGWEDSLEKEMATHSSILPWRIPWTEEPCGLQSIGLQRVGDYLVTEQQLQVETVILADSGNTFGIYRVPEMFTLARAIDKENNNHMKVL